MHNKNDSPGGLTQKSGVTGRQETLFVLSSIGDFFGKEFLLARHVGFLACIHLEFVHLDAPTGERILNV